MAQIFVGEGLRMLQTAKGPRIEFGVSGKTKPLTILVDREFGEEIPAEAHVERVKSGDRKLMLFPIGRPARQAREANWVFAIDRFPPIDGEGVALDYEETRAHLTLVDLRFEASENFALVGGTGEPGVGLGFAILLDDGDRIVSEPVEETFWVAWNDRGVYRREIMTEDRYYDVFENTGDEWGSDDYLYYPDDPEDL